MVVAIFGLTTGIVLGGRLEAIVVGSRKIFRPKRSLSVEMAGCSMTPSLSDAGGSATQSLSRRTVVIAR
jgi:hypothetical protein